MNLRYPIPAATTRITITVVNSRFIGTADYTPSVESARAFVASIKAELPDATHHCHAFLIGYGASVTAGLSDAGEPAGTAGRPMLAVLRGADLGDVTVVVTRYFGGTLLGTGALCGRMAMRPAPCWPHCPATNMSHAARSSPK